MHTNGHVMWKENNYCFSIDFIERNEYERPDTKIFNIILLILFFSFFTTWFIILSNRIKNIVYFFYFLFNLILFEQLVNVSYQTLISSLTTHSEIFIIKKFCSIEKNNHFFFFSVYFRSFSHLFDKRIILSVLCLFGKQS